METVILYSESLATGPIKEALAGCEVVLAQSLAALARAVVALSRLSVVVIEKRQIDEELHSFLFSLKKSFPILPACLISDAEPQRLPAGYRLIARGLEEDQIAAEVSRFVSSIDQADRRDRLRFDWPLQGSLSFDRQNWQTYNLWALSGDGAFLECSGTPPQAGSQGTLSISFQNTRMVTRCQVLDPRQASSKLPAGFAVRFIQHSEATRKLIDHTVQDALLRTLLEPEADPEVPAIGEEDLSISGFEPL